MLNGQACSTFNRLGVLGYLLCCMSRISVRFSLLQKDKVGCKVQTP